MAHAFARRLSPIWVSVKKYMAEKKFRLKKKRVTLATAWPLCTPKDQIIRTQPTQYTRMSTTNHDEAVAVTQDGGNDDTIHHKHMRVALDLVCAVEWAILH